MPNVRHVTAISARIRKLLNPANPDSVAIDDPVSKYVLGGQAAIDAFVVGVMNRYPPFQRDGLNLAPGDVRKNPKVYHLIAATVRNYEKRGWIVKW